MPTDEKRGAEVALKVLLSTATGKAECWQWLRQTRGNRYGKICPRRGTSKMVHRWYWESLYGPVPVGMDLHHRCANRFCFNPAHLQPMSRRAHRFVEPNNMGWGLSVNSCQRGHGAEAVVVRSGNGVAAAATLNTNGRQDSVKLPTT